MLYSHKNSWQDLDWQELVGKGRDHLKRHQRGGRWTRFIIPLGPRLCFHILLDSLGTRPMKERYINDEHQAPPQSWLGVDWTMNVGCSGNSQNQAGSFHPSFQGRWVYLFNFLLWRIWNIHNSQQKYIEAHVLTTSPNFHEPKAASVYPRPILYYFWCKI